MLGNRTGLVARRLCGAAITIVMLLSLLPVGGVLASPPAIPVLGAVATGTHHTCAVANDGSVWCWGTDQYGQLGDGLATPVTRLAAARVIGISRATAVVAGQQHTCALLSTGTAECWGRNDEHQLGDGTNQALSTTPVAVEGLHHAVALSARGDHTCALLDDATIKCWGDDQGGGLNTAVKGPLGATSVAGVSGVIQVSAGVNNDCVVVSGGVVKCWGTNKYGQLGDGTQTPSATPVTVAGLGAAVAVGAGRVFTCAVLVDGTAWCWGRNNNEVLGQKFLDQSLTPIQINGVNSAVGIAAFDPVCALIADRTMRCWGLGTSGQQGDGAHHDNWIPATPIGIDTAVGFDVGPKHVCAARADGSVWCWGDYSDDAVGVHSPGLITTPAEAAGFDAGATALGNDERSGAHAIPSLPFSDSFDPAAATVNGTDPTPTCAPSGLTASAWYTYKSDSDRSVSLATPTTGVAAAAYIDNGSGLTEIGCATSAGAAILEITGGVRVVLIVVSDGSSSPVAVELSGGAAPGNDDFGDATVVGSLPYTDSVDTTTASVQPNEPKPSCASNQPPFNSVWYRYDAAADATVAPTASGYPLRVAVYTGTTLNGLTQIACIGGSSSVDRFNVSVGSSYFVQVYGLDGSGSLSFGLAQATLSDTTDPTVDSPPAPTPQAGTVLGSAQTRVQWAGHDDQSGIDHYELQRKNGSGAWIALTTTTDTKFVVAEKLGISHTFRVRAFDKAGNVSGWSVGPTYTPTLKESTWAKITYTGAWVTDTISGASGTGVRRTLQQGATATFTFTGRAFQIVGIKGPGRTTARVSVDGVNTLVDLSAGSVTLQWVAFARSFATSGTHTIVIRNQSSARLEIDALVIYK